MSTEMQKIIIYAWGQIGQGNKAIIANIDLSITLNTTTLFQKSYGLSNR